MANQDWHNADIIAAIKKSTGLSLVQLAKNNGLQKQACQQALHRPQERAEQVIANAIGVSAHIIWPSRYNEFGIRRRKLHQKPKSGFSYVDTKKATTQGTADKNV